MDSNFLNIVANKDRLQKELVFYSLYLMIFENFVSDWKEKSLDFYSNWRIKDEQTGEYYYFVKTELVDGDFRSTRDMEKEKQYNRDVFQRVKENGKSYPKLSLFLWMAEMQFINEADYQILKKCYSKRNEYAHGIDKCLERFVSKEEKNLLISLIEISKKASKNWFYYVELPTNPNIDPQKLVYENTNTGMPLVYTGTELFYSLVLANLNDIFDGEDENANH